MLFSLHALLSERSRALPVTTTAVVKSRLTCDSFVWKLNMFFKDGSALSTVGFIGKLTFCFFQKRQKRTYDKGRWTHGQTLPWATIYQPPLGAADDMSFVFRDTFFHYKVCLKKRGKNRSVGCLKWPFSYLGSWAIFRGASLHTVGLRLLSFSSHVPKK